MKYQIFEGSSPGPQVIEGIVARKPRPPTAHQLAVERNRHQRVDYILDRGIRESHRKSRRARKTDGAIIRAHKRLMRMSNDYFFEDSEGEDNMSANKHQLVVGPNAYAQNQDPSFPFRERGFGGLVQLSTEVEDFGEEISAYAASIRRAGRRLDRWEAHTGPELGVIAPIKRPRTQAELAALNGEKDPNETEEDPDQDPDATQYTQYTADDSLLLKPARRRVNGNASPMNGDTNMEDADDLNDEDKELLGLASDRDEADEDLDDLEMTLLGRKEDDSDTE